MTDGTGSDELFKRISTGIVELDEILDGGIPANSINILMGHPGTGKTILAEQILFSNAGDDRPVLFLTTLSEPLSKVVSYLQRFTFFDATRIGTSVIYDDIGAELSEKGTSIVVERVRQYIRELGPRIIVIDSFKAIHDMTGAPMEMRRLVSDLAGLLGAYETTTFLVGEYDESQIPLFPEFAVADGIIELARVSSAKRDDRYLRVLKLRGSRYAEGFHAFRLTPDGLDVFPRLVSPMLPPTYRTDRERVSTGVEGLDQILDGGLWRGSSNLIAGPAGSGKTTVGLQFISAAVQSGERSLYVNFQENPSQLARAVAALGSDLADLQRKGLYLQYSSPVELQIDSILVELFDTIRREKIKRVVIDALGDLIIAAADRERVHDYLYALGQHFTVSGITSLIMMEGTMPLDAPGGIDNVRFGSLFDSLVELGVRMGESPVRTLRVVKGRGIAHDLRVHRMTIGQGGIIVEGPLEWS
jgi:circadian clock protein KaiC